MNNFRPYLTQSVPAHLQHNTQMHHQNVSLSSMMHWLIASCSGKFLYQWNTNMIWFENEQDLIFFKLRWKGNG